jgi:hypothetical protein
MTCQSLFGVGEGDGVGDGFALAEDLADDFFVDALDLALDLAASEGEASESDRTPAMAKEQSRRLIILYKMQEKCHFANRMPVGEGMCLGRSKIAGESLGDGTPSCREENFAATRCPSGTRACRLQGSS